jgi:hypothetical protein
MAMNARTRWVIGIAAALAAAAAAQDFHEGWETAQVRDYTPSETTYINGDEGFWFLGDSNSQFPDCGPTRNQAQILVQSGSRVLRLLSNRSFTNCADDIWVLLAEFESFNLGFGIPLTPDTTISFNEFGELEDPQLHNGGVNCLVPPCFDNISLVLTDNRGNILAYVLQRYPGAVENAPNINYGDVYREIFLDPAGGSYRRNLFNDFQRIRTFNPTGARVSSIEFRVDEHGWAVIDNIIIDSTGTGGSLPVHRFWSPVTSSHFYTMSESERQRLVDLHADVWIYEGVAFRALPENSETEALPVYRFWSPVTGSHFYTMDEAERNKLLTEYQGIWIPEGIEFYAFMEGSQPADTVPVYRFWSPVTGSHFFTANETEADTLIREHSDVWIFEGVAWYAFRP